MAVLRYFDEATGTYVDLPGLPGPPGVQGPTGGQGNTGPAGPPGPQGDQGDEGPQGPIGVDGPQGPRGDQGDRGEAGQATVIVAAFGQVQGEGDLPPTGFIPAGWDGPGRPIADIQVPVGAAVIYEPSYITDPPDEWGDVWVFLGVGFGWSFLGKIVGPEGPPGVPALERGGLINQALLKNSNADFDVDWQTVVRADGTVPVTGADLSVATDGQGVTFAGAGRIYKLNGGGMRLRKSSGGQQWQIEDNNGANATNVLVAAGGSMTGPLTLSGPPTAANHAATKSYVDPPGWTGLGLQSALGGAAAYRVAAGIVSLRVWAARGGANVGNNQLVVNLPAGARANYDFGAMGTNKENGQSFWLIHSDGRVRIMSGGDTQDAYLTIAFPAA